MMTEMDDTIERFDAQIAELEVTMSGATSMAATFRSEMQTMQGSMLFTAREASSMSRTVSNGLRGAFEDAVFGGERLTDALRDMAGSVLDAAYRTAVGPVQSGLLDQLLPFADGGVISQGRVTPFARGGVVNAPTTFPMRGGTGLMGEAGPEAIMPLRRGADGKLGVAAAGGGGAVQVTMNITTPDVAGFRRSSSQVAAEMQRALARGQRNR